MSEFEGNVERILRLLQSTFGENFKTYYNGDPTAIPRFNLPAIIVSQLNDDTVQGQQGEDDVEDQIIVKVVYNTRDDWEGNKVDPLNLTEKKLRDVIGSRDLVTGLYGSKTVKGTIRGMALNGITAVANSMHVEYGVASRIAPTEEHADFTTEGHVTFTIQYSVFTD